MYETYWGITVCLTHLYSERKQNVKYTNSLRSQKHGIYFQLLIFIMIFSCQFLMECRIVVKKFLLTTARVKSQLDSLPNGKRVVFLLKL